MYQEENELLGFIEDLKVNGYNTSKECENYVSFPLEKRDGFLIYSNDTFYQDDNRLLNFSQKAQKHFKKNPQHHRYYFYHSINNNIVSKNLVFILYNPSYAIPETNDPTINNCISIAKNNYSSIEIVNIYSERNPNVKNLTMKDNHQNVNFIKSFIKKRVDSDIVFAWGKKKLPEGWHYIIEECIKDNKNIKIISSESFPKNIIRHPGNQGWCRIGGFKKSANLYTPEYPLEIIYIGA